MTQFQRLLEPRGDWRQGESPVEMTDDGPLDHPNREAIYDLVQGSPGMNRNQLCRHLGLSLSGATYHLDRLLDAGLIIRKPGEDRREKLLFTRSNVHLWEDPQTRLLFGAEATRNIALDVLGHPSTSTEEIAERSGIQPATVRYHLNKLQDAGLVTSYRIGNNMEHHPEAAFQVWVDEVCQEYDPIWSDQLAEPMMTPDGVGLPRHGDERAPSHHSL